MIAPSRLTLARQRRGLSKKLLAERANITPKTLAAYESGESSPPTETLQRLAGALNFPLSFFGGAVMDVPPPLTVSFRSLSSMTAVKRDAAIAAGALAVQLARWIETRFRLPVADIPDLRNQEIQGLPETEPSDEDSIDPQLLVEAEIAAGVVREVWGRGNAPIRNMVHLLEAHGVRVFSLAEENDDVDAFSFWRDGSSYVFLNTRKLQNASTQRKYWRI